MVDGLENKYKRIILAMYFIKEFLYHYDIHSIALFLQYCDPHHKVKTCLQKYSQTLKEENVASIPRFILFYYDF